ncbi:MAG TPA: hypothetical protein VFT87_01940 [Candidatus Saccharimonadales bacterium]|nr:hypothetical protein [Candidatus Saccharimonadales bacterium]
MLNQLGNKRWRLSGKAVEVWLTKPDPHCPWRFEVSIGLVRFELDFDFTHSDVWVILDEGVEDGGLVVHIVNGQKLQEWRVKEDLEGIEGAPKVVEDSAHNLFHWHHCRGRQYGCWCAND